MLDAPPPLDCVRAGYFARVTARLLARRTAAVTGFLRAHPAALAALVAHVDTASVAEVVARLLGADDAMGLPADELAWLADAGVLDGLLGQLGPAARPDAQKHAAAVLAAVVRAHGSPLLPAFAEAGFLGRLLDRALARGGGGEEEEEGAAAANGGDSPALPPTPPSLPSVQALEVAIALLEPKDPPAEPHLLPPSAAAAAAEIDIAIKDAAVAGVVARLPALVALLDAAPAAAQETPYGVLAPPLGLTRIKAVALLVALLRTGRGAAVEGVVNAGAVSKCLALVLSFPFNNLLHHHVAALLLTALDGDAAGGAGPPALLDHVLHGVRLPAWLAGAPAEVRPVARQGDARAGSRAPLRAGYLGHVTHLGNRLLALAAAGNSAVAAALSGEALWGPWAAGALAERTARDDPDAWACGRPAPAPFGAGLLGAPSMGEGDGYGVWGPPGGLGAGEGDDDDDGDDAAPGRPPSPPPARAALNLQSLAEAAASVGALRISGAVPPPERAGGRGSPTLSSSSSSDDADDEDSSDDDGGGVAVAPSGGASPPGAPAPDAAAAPWQAFPDAPPPSSSPPPPAASGAPEAGSPPGEEKKK